MAYAGCHWTFSLRDSCRLVFPSKQPVRQAMLVNMMKVMSQKAERPYLTNHCVRATSVTVFFRQVILDSIHFHLDSIVSYLHQPSSIITRLFVKKKKLNVCFKVMLHGTIFYRATSVAHNMLHNLEQTSNNYNVRATN